MDEIKCFTGYLPAIGLMKWLIYFIVCAVDFPSSPGALRSTDGGVRLATEEEEREEDYDSGCLYTAEATPPTGRVAMRKSEDIWTVAGYTY